jgi:hypothetical protein
VIFFLSDGSEVTFFHGNKEYEYGKANVVWIGDKATRKTFPLAQSDASYFFRRKMDIYSNDDRFIIGVRDRATGEQITQMSALAPKYGYLVTRVTVTVHNTTGDAKAWLDNLGYWFAPGRSPAHHAIDIPEGCDYWGDLIKPKSFRVRPLRGLAAVPLCALLPAAAMASDAPQARFEIQVLDEGNSPLPASAWHLRKPLMARGRLSRSTTWGRRAMGNRVSLAPLPTDRFG